MDNKLSELKSAAIAATPGPWSWKLDGIFYYLSPDGVNTPLERIIDDGSAWGEYAETIEHDSPDARFIAAANPAAVLELLAVQDINQLKRQLAELSSHKCQCGESMPGQSGVCFRNGEAACGQTQIWRELMLKTL
ncbi:hypothetical protein [Serratia bockelmannii]|uniref:hypothetical protein n=1 Tax=Serratia bockelmannii TaxID=2703793 RepID=UPI002361C9EB|nr:hypothetical protein [Serratia bockelmannii]